MPVWGYIIVATVVVLGAGLWLAARWLFRLALYRHSDKMIVLRNLKIPKDPSADDLSLPYSAASMGRWRENLGGEDVFRRAPDGTTLHAVVAEQPGSGDRWAVVMHGYTMRHPLSIYAKHFHDASWNLLVPTQRGHGQSGGDYITMGWQDRLDLVDWIAWLIERHPEAKMVLHGVSMGGSTALMAAGELLPGNVRCVISDCAFSTARDQFAHQLKLFFKLPAFPLLDVALLQAKLVAGIDIRQADAVAQVRKSRLPMLFIHGGKDRFVPAWMQDVLYEAAPGHREKLCVEEAEHGMSTYLEPELYWGTVWNFIEKVL